MRASFRPGSRLPQARFTCDLSHESINNQRQLCSGSSHSGPYLRVSYRVSCGQLLRLPLGRSLDLSVKLPSVPEFVLAVSGAR